jgi:hypothetical protein
MEILMANSNRTGGKVATVASNTLRSGNACAIQKSLAGSALSQSGTSKTTSKAIETKASAALKSSSSSPTTKTLAGSVVSQSNKKP